MNDSWQRFQAFTDLTSAQAVAGRLELGGVPVRHESIEALTGVENGFWLLVPDNLAHRARWILAQSEMSDAELAFLATGRLGDAQE
jgi:hypothetical protein